LNKTGAVEVALRDKLYNFAHLLTTAGNSEDIPPIIASTGNNWF
jgi:hypothetical protein